MKGRKHSNKRKQRGGNPAIIPILTAANEVAKLVKPATRLKGTRLGKVPVLGSILETLSQMGYGYGVGPLNMPIEGDVSHFKKRRLPMYANEGILSSKNSSVGPLTGSGLQLFAY